MMVTLDKIESGTQVRIISFRNLQIASRLMSMGIIPGTIVFITRRTLAGSTYFLQFPQLSLALRKEEVEQIIVE